LSVTANAGRGTRNQPGLVLGLEPGELCEGLALRLDEATLARDLELLWRREMIAGAYAPRWLDAYNLTGELFGPILAFTSDRESPHYAGKLTEATIVGRLAVAKGRLGSNADYLLRTCRALRDLNIPDAYLEALCSRLSTTE
jgi:cation transport protein ChaC